MQPTTLTDGIIRLRPASPDDLSAIQAASATPGFVASPWLPLRPEASLVAANRLLRSLQRGWQRSEQFGANFFITDQKILLGLLDLHRHGPTIELGYALASEARGQGFAHRAVELVCQWLPSQGISEVHLRIAPENPASQAVAERSGFHYCQLVTTRQNNQPDLTDQLWSRQLSVIADVVKNSFQDRTITGERRSA